MIPQCAGIAGRERLKRGHRPGGIGILVDAGHTAAADYAERPEGCPRRLPRVGGWRGGARRRRRRGAQQHAELAHQPVQSLRLLLRGAGGRG